MASAGSQEQCPRECINDDRQDESDEQSAIQRRADHSGSGEASRRTKALITEKGRLRMLAAKQGEIGPTDAAQEMPARK